MKNLRDIKYYLKSKSAEGLRTLMVNNSTKAGKYYGYTIIHADGFWYAWFEDSDDRELNTNDTIDINKG